VPVYLTGVGTVIAYDTDVVRAQIQWQIISIIGAQTALWAPGCRRLNVEGATITKSLDNIRKHEPSKRWY
jgi:hypothetical protein